MTDINLADLAYNGELTVEEVNGTTRKKLETDVNENGNKVLLCASRSCGIEVIEAIINKGVNIDGLSDVSIVVLIIIK
jgi:hypothetical protein